MAMPTPIPSLAWLLWTWLLTIVVAKDLRLLSYAALGDSYAAGDGAGSSRLLPHLDITCGRFSDAYPYQLLKSQEIDFSQRWPYFEYKACGGATTGTVNLNQKFTFRHKDLVTVQVGGNEVDFFLILNECIQQWHPISSCPRELERARDLIIDSSFKQRFHSMVRGIRKWQSDIDTNVFVLGYARFFNSATTQCNNVSFSVTNPASVLSQKLRHDLNELVDLLNGVIRAGAEENGAVYVDVDALFEGHRFCEVNVQEPREDWDGTWFFRSSDQKLDNDMFNQVALTRGNPFSKFIGLTRSFHPTTNGHAVISREIERLFRALNPEDR